MRSRMALSYRYAMLSTTYMSNACTPSVYDESLLSMAPVHHGSPSATTPQCHRGHVPGSKMPSLLQASLVMALHPVQNALTPSIESCRLLQAAEPGAADPVVPAEVNTDAPDAGVCAVDVEGVDVPAGAAPAAGAPSSSLSFGRSPRRIQRSMSGCIGSVSLSERRPKIRPTLTKWTKQVLSSRCAPNSQKLIQCCQYRCA